MLVTHPAVTTPVSESPSPCAAEPPECGIRDVLDRIGD